MSDKLASIDPTNPRNIKITGATVDAATGNVTFPATVTAASFSGSSSALPTGFTSSAQTLTYSTPLTVAHGLGGVPRFAKVIAKCISTEGNYSVGDLVEIASCNGSANIGINVFRDTTNVIVLVGNTIRILDKTLCSNFDATAAKWNLIIDAFL